MSTFTIILIALIFTISAFLWLIRPELEGRCRGCGKKLKDENATYCSYECSKE